MNHDAMAQDLVLNFGDVPGIDCQKCNVRCLYAARHMKELCSSVVQLLQLSKCTIAEVRMRKPLGCVQDHSDLGVHDSSFTARAVPSHDSRMFVLS